MTNDQFNRLILTNESVSKSQNSCITSSLYRFLQISFTLTPPQILFFTLFFKKQPAVWQYLLTRAVRYNMNIPNTAILFRVTDVRISNLNPVANHNAIVRDVA